jgi:hypothetical protein
MFVLVDYYPRVSTACVQYTLAMNARLQENICIWFRLNIWRQTRARYSSCRCNMMYFRSMLKTMLSTARLWLGVHLARPGTRIVHQACCEEKRSTNPSSTRRFPECCSESQLSLRTLRMSLCCRRVFAPIGGVRGNVRAHYSASERSQTEARCSQLTTA